MSTKLLRRGSRLAVLGVADGDFATWHVVGPGISLPVITTGGGDGLRMGTSLCRKSVWTNGYAQDHKPPDGALCKACAERL